METKKTNLFRVEDNLFVAGMGWGKYDSPNDNYGRYHLINFPEIGEFVLPIEVISFTEYPINANHTRPFEGGDIVYNEIHDIIAIYDSESKKGLACRVFLMMQPPCEPVFKKNNTLVVWIGYTKDYISATPEQKQLLFDRLAQDNLRWNEETRKLEELDETAKKFVVGEDICVMWNSKEEIVIEMLTVAQESHSFGEPEKHVYNRRYKNCIKFDAKQNQGAEIWNEEARKLEELNEPKVGDYVIFFDFQKYSTAMVGKLKAIYNNRVYNYRATHGCFENCIKWDGTKEHLDSVRNGIIK